MSSTKLSAQIRSIKGNSHKLRDQIQDALISCAYYAVKDGQVTPFNQLLEAVGTNTRVKGLTAWAETWGFVRIVHGKFELNKHARKEAHVRDEADFEAFEAAMRSAPSWYDIVPKEKVESIFDASHYLTNVLAKLDKEGQKELADVIEKAISAYNEKVALDNLKLEAETCLKLAA